MPANATKATPSARTRARKPRRDWRPLFLDGFARTGTVTSGCAHAGIHRATAYRERERDPRFAAKWAALEEEVTDRLEETALQLALAGEVKLLEFLLRARKPQMYRERHLLEHTGPGGGPVAVHEALGDLSKLSDRELTALQRLLTKAREP